MSMREDRLRTYKMAAGVSAVAMAGTAHAGIVYSGPQNIAIGQGLSQALNLDGDSFNDVTLKNFVFGGGNYQGASVIFAPGKIVGFTAGFAYVSALSAGAIIDPSTAGPSFQGSMAYGALNPNAQFNNVTDKYIGLSFPSGANTYYGWVRVDVNNAAGTFLIKDWAYEAVPGFGIIAGAGVPEPTSLSLLAAGASGLLLMRRKHAAR